MTRRALLLVEPLSDWPYPDRPRTTSPFEAPWGTTRDELLREADHLGADRVVLEVDCSRRHLRQDGELRADARLHSGRVRISMDTQHGPMRWALDRYEDAGLSWQPNVRAVVLTLDALRRIERYGAVADGQQYRGFLALEAPRGPQPFSRADEGLAWLREKAGPGNEFADARRAYLRAAQQVHPDRGADRDQWDRLDEAKQLLTAAGLL